MPYQDSVLDEQKIRSYARKVARELLAKFEAEDHWINAVVTEDEWVDETVSESRWFGLRTVEVTRRVNRPRTVDRRVRAQPPSGWILRSLPTSTRRIKLDKRGDYGEETDRYTYWLMADGRLRTNHYFNYDGILDGRYFQGSRTDDWSDMTTGEMLEFDRGRGGGVWAPERGVGIHARLTKLRRTGA